MIADGLFIVVVQAAHPTRQIEIQDKTQAKTRQSTTSCCSEHPSTIHQLQQARATQLTLNHDASCNSDVAGIMNGEWWQAREQASKQAGRDHQCSDAIDTHIHGETASPQFTSRIHCVNTRQSTCKYGQLEHKSKPVLLFMFTVIARERSHNFMWDSPGLFVNELHNAPAACLQLWPVHM